MRPGMLCIGVVINDLAGTISRTGPGDGVRKFHIASEEPLGKAGDGFEISPTFISR